VHRSGWFLSTCGTVSPDGHERSPGKGTAPRRPHAVRRVLVVDDDEDARDSLALIVGALGLEVRKARDGREAIGITSVFRPDVVLLDLSLGPLSGYEVASRIRSEPWGGGVTLVAMTGWAGEADLERTRAAGFDHHLVKPARTAELRRILAP